MPEFEVNFELGKALASQSEYRSYGVNSVDVDLAYIVSITSVKQGRVSAVLQDKVQYRVSSQWDSLIPDITGSREGEIANRLMQLATGVSLVNKLGSRRFWKATTPIEITLPLKFEAVGNAQTEVVDAVRVLQSLALPGDATTNATAGLGQLMGKVWGAVTPPGPSPFVFSDEGSTPNAGQSAREMVANRKEASFDRIVVSVGRFLLFPSVIVKSAQVEFGTKFNSEGKPLSADLQLVFETYQIVTKEMLDKIYRGIGTGGKTP